jgi:hypothetical protein
MAKTTRCKFRCWSEKKYASSIWDAETQKSSPGFLYEYAFNAVTEKDGENAKFFASTPTGELKFAAVREGLFTPGKEYYLDITPAEGE